MLMLTDLGHATPGDDEVPHSACYNVPYTHNEWPTVTTICKAVEDMYIIPDNFVVSRLHWGIGRLEITGGSVRIDPVTPIPSRSILLTVHLERFNTAKLWPPFPISKFFSNVKAHLELVSLTDVKLLKIRNRDFSGFQRLQTLRLIRVQVTEINYDIFESLTFEGSSPVLAHVEILHGRVTFLDWAFLKPISESLKASTFFFRNNSFTSIDPCIFDTIYPDASVALELGSSHTQFCYRSSCDCCELKPLAHWLRSNGIPLATRSINCGGNRTTYQFGAFPGSLVFEDDKKCPLKPFEPYPIRTTMGTITTVRPSAQPGFTCESPFKQYYDGCYWFSTANHTLNWERASSYCSLMNSSLVIIRNDGDNSFVRDNIATVSSAWIGYRRADGTLPQHQFLSSEGLIVNINLYNNFDNALQPEPYYCFAISSSNSSKLWLPLSCGDERVFACSYFHRRQYRPTVPDMAGLQLAQFSPSCDPDWMLSAETQFCYKVKPENVTYRMAKDACENEAHDSNLVHLESWSEFRLVQGIIMGLHKVLSHSNYWIAMGIETSTERHWQYRQAPRTVKTISRSEYDLGLQGAPEMHPSNHTWSIRSSTCLVFKPATTAPDVSSWNPASSWMDFRCNALLPSICKRPSFTSKSTTATISNSSTHFFGSTLTQTIFNTSAPITTPHVPQPSASRALPTLSTQPGVTETTATKDPILSDVEVAIVASVAVLVSFGVVLFLGLRYQRRRREKRNALKRTSDPRTWFRSAADGGKFASSFGIGYADCEYARLLEVDPTGIEMSDRVLGRGQFGVVYKATAFNLPTVSKSPVTVAVKTLHQTATDEALQLLDDEFKVMLKCGRHVNIVNILGVIHKGWPFLILEYCEFGSLLGYLKSRQGTRFYSTINAEGQMSEFKQDDMRDLWLDICSREDRVDTIEEMQKTMLSTHDLIKFSHQTCKGMEYLSARRIIHRDLAARNVLVASSRIIKISDFGLARHGEDIYTVSNDQIPLPILWMPPDTILERQFSQKSDVWSYGVLLWEIFCLGRTPFSDGDVAKFSATVFADWLLQGHQMPRPFEAPLQMYDLMRSCWSITADARPTFSELLKTLDMFTLSAFASTPYLAVDDPDYEPSFITEKMLRFAEDLEYSNATLDAPI
ncbi:Mast/stem cell growth factor receptor kita [Hypsibius exemplaris]|uniref:Mast/stem cell growth factor receptor kita n=1 Tax=Hypsibius exemplaris TaxID=2072580 RepID=A0A1W0WXY1_HYPEX|nr:Mast/stem cell growth factor receptor kita [Hypsibius exemplaris]